MKHFILTLLSLLIFTSPVHAWIIQADFENGVVGQDADGNDGFSDAFLNTKYTNAQVHSGKQAAVTSIKNGDPAFGIWGGTFVYPTVIKEGGQIWYRVWLYYPTGFPFNDIVKGEGMKMMRIHTRSSAGDNEGFQHIYMKGDTSTTGKVVIGSEVNGKAFFTNNGPSPYDKLRNVGVPINSGTWGAYEIYIKFSGTPGKGIYRTWQNGKLIFEDTTTATMRSTSSNSDFIYLWSYWPHLASATAYVDDVLITNEVPGNKDAQGNPFVGVGNAKFLAPPKPPTGVGATKK